jgi:hypothetical protein
MNPLAVLSPDWGQEIKIENRSVRRETKLIFLWKNRSNISKAQDLQKFDGFNVNMNSIKGLICFHFYLILITCPPIWRQDSQRILYVYLNVKTYLLY